MIMTIRFLPFVLALLLLGCASTSALSPFYKAEGVNLDGRPYTTAVRIDQKSNLAFVLWTYADGTQVRGFGLIQGGAFSVGFYTRQGEYLGIAVFKIQEGGKRLKGTWTLVGVPETTTEDWAATEAEELPAPPPAPPAGESL